MQYFSGCSGSLTSGVVNRSALANSEDRARREARLGGGGGIRGTGKGAVVGEGLPAPLLTQSDPAESNEPRPCENG